MEEEIKNLNNVIEEYKDMYDEELAERKRLEIIIDNIQFEVNKV